MKTIAGSGGRGAQREHQTVIYMTFEYGLQRINEKFRGSIIDQMMEKKNPLTDHELVEIIETLLK